MHTLETIDTKGRTSTYTFPGAWGECTVEQLGLIAALMSTGLQQAKEDELADTHVRIALLQQLSGMDNATFGRIEPGDLLGLRPDNMGVERVALLPQLDWALADPIFEQSIVPELVVDGSKWLGPRDRLANFSLTRWGFCDKLTAVLAKSPSESALNNLLAALYHPENEKWTNEGLVQRGELLAGLPARTKLAAVMNYRGLRAALAQRYPKCFRGGGEEDPRGLQGMVVRLAGVKFGTVPETYQANLHDVLVHVEQQTDDVERAKQNN